MGCYMRYRSPDVAIDDAVWHVTVRENSGRLCVIYNWRKSEREMWQPLTRWPGRLPKGLWEFFQPYRASINVALKGAPYHSAAAQHRAGKAA